MARTKQTNKKRTDAEMLADSASPPPAKTAAKKRAVTKKKAAPTKKKPAAAPKKKKSVAAPKKKAPASPTTPATGFNSVPEQPIPAAPAPAAVQAAATLASLATKENTANQPSNSLPFAPPNVAPPSQFPPPVQAHFPSQPWQQQQQQQQLSYGPPAQYGPPAPPSAPVWLTGPNGEPMLFYNGQLIPLPPQIAGAAAPSVAAAPASVAAQSVAQPIAQPAAPPGPLITAPAPSASTNPLSSEPDYLSELAKDSKKHTFFGNADADAKIRSRSQGSVEYTKRKQREFTQFIDWIKEHPVLSHWGEMVRSKNDSDEEIPKWIHALQNIPSNNKQAQSICNTIFIEWFETQKDATGLQLMQPGSMETKIKKLFSTLHQQFQVHIGLQHLKGPGSLYAHCEDRWKEVAEHDPKFGSKPFREVFTDEELRTVADYIRSLDTLDLDARAHQVAVVSLGRHLAFRGRTDHYNLTWDMVVEGVFEPIHPLAGQEFVQIGNGLLSKHNQLTFGNTTAKADVEAPRIPIRMDDPFNAGAALRRLRRLTPPDAKFVFMAEVKPGSNQHSLYLQSGIEGSTEWRYHHQMSMGITKIGSCTQEIAKAAGLSNWKKKTNHCLRNTAITDMANNPNVNQKETANLARHKSETSQNAYIKPSAKAEVSRIGALELKPEANNTPRAAYPSTSGVNPFHSAQQIAQMTHLQPQQSFNPYAQPISGTSNAAPTPNQAHNTSAPATGNPFQRFAASEETAWL